MLFRFTGRDGDDQDVTEASRFLKMPDVANMQDVEDAVGVHDSFPLGPQASDLSCKVRNRTNFSANLVALSG